LCQRLRDPCGIWQQLKVEQLQGHGHLQLIHSKSFPNAIPGLDRESEMRCGLRPCSELGRHWPLSFSL
jgi:hypothetical protein